MNATPKAEPFPVLLNTSDALVFAADRLDKMCVDLEIISLVSGVLLKTPPATHPEGDTEGRAAQEQLRVMSSGIVDKDLQIRAMRDAAKEIRAMANETKLAEARASARGIRA